MLTGFIYFVIISLAVSQYSIMFALMLTLHSVTLFSILLEKSLIVVVCQFLNNVIVLLKVFVVQYRVQLYNICLSLWRQLELLDN